MSNQFNFYQLIKSRIQNEVLLNNIKDAKYSGTVLILDDKSSQLINEYFQLKDLIQIGVTFVESLSKVWKPYKEFQAIYIVDALRNSFELIDKDFKDQQLYKALSVYVISALDQQLIAFIKQLSIRKKINTLKDLNLDFDIYQKNIFKYKGESLKDIQASIQSVLSINYVFQIAQIFTLKDNKDVRVDQVKDFLSSFLTAKQNNPNDQIKSNNNIKILILNRAYDLVLPLMHLPYYQALLQDFLQLNTQQISINNNVQQIDPKTDALYDQIQSSFITSAMQQVSQQYQDLIKNNQTAKFLQNQKQDNGASINQLQGALGDMNVYNQSSKQLSLHFQLLKIILEKTDKSLIKSIMDLELCLATGIDENGGKITKEDQEKKLINFIQKNSQLSSNDLFRLLLIAQGILLKETDFSKFLNAYQKETFSVYSELIKKYGKLWSKKLKDFIRQKSKQKYNQVSSHLLRHYYKLEFLIDEIFGQNKETFLNKTEININQTQNIKSFFPQQNTDPISNSKSLKNDLFCIIFLDKISINEFSLIENSLKNQADIQTIVGCLGTVTPDQFLNNLQTLQQNL